MIKHGRRNGQNIYADLKNCTEIARFRSMRSNKRSNENYLKKESCFEKYLRFYKCFPGFRTNTVAPIA